MTKYRIVIMIAGEKFLSEKKYEIAECANNARIVKAMLAEDKGYVYSERVDHA